MSGFEWSTKLEANKRHGVEQAVAELRELAADLLTPPALRYFAGELADIYVIKPEHPDDVYLTDIKPDGTKQPYATYREYFGDTLPSESEILVYCWEIPWLWKMPTEAKTTIANIFEKYDVIEVWWDIVGDGTRSSDLMDAFWRQHGEEIFGSGAGMTKNKAPREY